MARCTTSRATIETPFWTLKPGRLDGQTCYDFVAEGMGPLKGVTVLWGRSALAPDSPNLRRFKVMIGSEPLWRHYANGGDAHSCATEILALRRGDLWESEPREVKVRRLDICIDHWGYEWSQLDLLAFACRQKVRGFWEANDTKPLLTSTFHGPVSATYYVGARGGSSRFLRVYDKIAEAQKKGKLPWMEPIWRQCGWNGRDRIWRAEIEIGGDWLAVHGFDNLEMLKGCEHAHWENYLGAVRHTNGLRTRAKRAKTSVVWTHFETAVSMTAKAGVKCSWVWKPRPPRVDGDMKIITAMQAGCARKLGAAMFNRLQTPADKAALLDYISRSIDASQEAADRRAASRHRPKREKDLLGGESGISS